MTMLVEIYFPNVKPALEEIWTAREAFNRITAEIKSTWNRDADVSGGDLKPRFLSVAEIIDERMQHLLNQIVIAARVHAGINHRTDI